MSRRADAVVVLLALLAATFFWLTTERVNRNDASLYFQLAKNVAEGHGLSSMKEPPHNWVGSREPLYPLMLGIPFRVFGASIGTVFVVQALLHALTAVLAGRIVLRIAGSARAAMVGAVVVAVFPTLANYTVYTMRETAFTFLVTLATVLTMAVMPRARVLVAAVAGLAWGAAILCRGVVLPLPVLLAGLLVVLAWRMPAAARMAAVRSAVVLVAFTALPIVTWSLYTARANADFSATPRAWQNLYVRASKAALTADEMKMYAVYCLSESLADRMFPGNNLRSVGEGYFYRGASEKLVAMRAHGMTPAQIEDRVRDETLALIAAHPIAYAATSVFEFVKFNSFFQVPLLNEAPAEARYGGTAILLGLRGVFKVAGFVLFALTLVGAYVSGRAGLIVAAVVLYFNGVHLVLDSIGRYAVPVAPLYLLLSLVAVRALVVRETAVERKANLVAVEAR